MTLRRLDRGTLRAALFVGVLTTVFLTVNTSVAVAAEKAGETGDLLAPLNVPSSEGAPVNGYELSADSGSVVDFQSQALSMALGGLFVIVRILVGLGCWAVEVAFRFPLIDILAGPAQQVSDAYTETVVNQLGLKGLMLSWAFIFGLVLFVRGKIGQGLGEIVLTLLIAAFAASAFVRPDYLLSDQGPLVQSQQAAAEVAQTTVSSYHWGGTVSSGGPCAGMAGNAEAACVEREAEQPVEAADVAKPIQDSVTNAVIVKPYMLLQYGRTLDPGKPADRKAYALHLKWVSGGYKPSPQDREEDGCPGLIGPADDFCRDGSDTDTEVPDLTSGSDLLDSATPVLSSEDQQFAAFLKDLEGAGPVGKASAEYAKDATWWRVGGAALLLIAALMICGMLLSAAVVLLVTQAADAAAAAAGVIVFVWGMLPGPNRQAVWKWAAFFAISILSMFVICMFLPFFGIAIDAVLTDGPDLMVERILLLDVLALVGLAFQRRLLTAMTSFGQRMAVRMRYSKIGGTHLPGDSSEIGAALAMNLPGAGGGGMRGSGGGHGMLGTRDRLMGYLASMADGAGMPLDTGRLMADAGAEASRGLAPLGVAAVGAMAGVRGSYSLLVGRRPDEQVLDRLRKPADDPDATGQGMAAAGQGGGRPKGPADRYRDEDGRVVNPDSGEVLHDQSADRPLLSTRAHNRLVRLRGYRIAHRGGRIAYGSTVGLPENVRRGKQTASRYSQDTRQQVRVWGNTIREDTRRWTGRGQSSRRISPTGRPPAGPGPGGPRPGPPPGPRGPGPGPGAGPRPAGGGGPVMPPRPPGPPRPTAPPPPVGPPKPIAPPRPTAPPPPPHPPAPAPRARTAAELRQRVINQLGAGDSADARRRAADSHLPGGPRNGGPDWDGS
ncbi:hypothetical protein [Streptomyces sp. NPDC058595]|uniref:hypothetical protein n=1 Tax=Streptomyces sp. NPDC058595 TaxID=3346550 RepID=UPI003667DF3E